MSRISIDVTDAQHAKLKALAAWKGSRSRSSCSRRHWARKTRMRTWPSWRPSWISALRVPVRRASTSAPSREFSAGAAAVEGGPPVPDYRLSPDARVIRLKSLPTSSRGWASRSATAMRLRSPSASRRLHWARHARSGRFRTSEVVVSGHHYVFALRNRASPVVILAVLHENMDMVVRLRDRLE